uniref:RAB19, member RAS onco family n=1 Tax=Anolis carolinensis TaxID=28377 RepID=A0A803TFG7_ANOCA
MAFFDTEVDENFDYLFKIILIGDSNVGKTCVVHRFKSGQYHTKQQNTIGVDFTVRPIEIDGKKVKIQVWDTAGQERFRTITQSFIKSFILTRRSVVDTHDKIFLSPGNKADEADKRQVLFEDACTLAEKHGLLAVLETSAKEAQNIDEVFTLMAKELIARNTLQLHGESSPLENIHLDTRPVIASQAESSSCSC